MYIDFGNEVWLKDIHFNMDEVAEALWIKLIKLYPDISIRFHGGRLNWFLDVRFIPKCDFEKIKKILSTYEKIDKIRHSRLMIELAKYKAV
jgi:hypothetical protein